MKSRSSKIKRHKSRVERKAAARRTFHKKRRVGKKTVPAHLRNQNRGSAVGFAAMLAQLGQIRRRGQSE
jgi:hypothetical protein